MITSSHIGGTENFLFQLVTHLDASRFQPEVCSLKKTGYYAQRLRERGIPVYSLNMPEEVNWMTPACCLLGLIRLTCLIRKGEYTCVHAFLYRANILSRIAGTLAGVPLIISSERGLTRHKHPVAVWLDRITAPLSRYTLAVSEAVARQLQVRERIHPARIRVIYSGVDTKRGANPEDILRLKCNLGLSVHEQIIGCVARLHPDKGVEDLVRAAAALELGSGNFRIILAGDGPERKPLEALAERLGVRSRILFLGFRNDVDSLLQTFDLFVLPSREEGLPMSVLEAMSFGIPVVATRVGGVPEIVLHNQTGILVPDHSPRELARAISTLIQDPALARKLGEAGRLRVRNQFSFRKTVEQIERLYEG